MIVINAVMNAVHVLLKHIAPFVTMDGTSEITNANHATALLSVKNVSHHIHPHPV